MRKILLILLFLGIVLQSYGEDKMFPEMENTVGYIITENGEKYIVVESNNGAKLVKTNKDPKKVIKKGNFLSKEDFIKLNEEGQ
jgi:hypothetical protein